MLPRIRHERRAARLPPTGQGCRQKLRRAVSAGGVAVSAVANGQKGKRRAVAQPADKKALAELLAELRARALAGHVRAAIKAKPRPDIP